MCGTLKSDQRLIEAIGLPVGLRVTPIPRVSRQAEDDFVAAKVLGALIRKTAARSGRADKSQTNRLVVRLVRTILAIGQDGDSERAALVG